MPVDHLGAATWCSLALIHCGHNWFKWSKWHKLSEWIIVHKQLSQPRSMAVLFQYSTVFSYCIWHHCIFTARCYASAVLAMGLCPSVCVSVCLSVTSLSSTKTGKHRITQTTSHDSPGTLVFWCQRYPRNSTGVTPYGGAECRWGGSKSATFY